MTNDTDKFEPDQARIALDSVHKYERIGLERGIPPLWFGISMGILGGLAVTLATLEYPFIIIVLIALMILMLNLILSLKMDVKIKSLYSPKALIVFIISLLVVLLPLVLVARSNLETFGTWLAIFTGLGLAIFASIVTIIERHKYLARLEKENTQ